MTILVWILALLLAILAVLVGGLALFTRNVARKVEAAMPPPGRFTDLPDGRIHWVEFGEGAADKPVLLMIHGLSGNFYNFTYATTGPLAEAYRVIVVDRPGCGHSKRASDAQARIPEQARMLAAFIEAENLGRPLVIGHSLGGAVALSMALNHPDHVGGLALIAPLTREQDRSPDVFRGIDLSNPVLRRIVAHTVATPASIRNGPKVVQTIFAPNAAPDDFRDRGGGLLSLRPDAFYAASTDMQAVPLDIAAMSTRYEEIRCPVGMIYGDADQVLDPDWHIEPLKTALPGLHLEVLPDTGHMVQISEPEATDRFIRLMASKISS